MGVKNLSWRESAIEVLKTTEPLHYTDIADQIIEKGLRSDVGATPAASVNAAITMSLQEDGENSPFVRVERGRYGLRQKVTGGIASGAGVRQVVETGETGLINA